MRFAKTLTFLILVFCPACLGKTEACSADLQVGTC
jgi:hypothetical protein